MDCVGCFTPAQQVRTKGGHEFEFLLNKQSEAGVNTHLATHSSVLDSSI